MLQILIDNIFAMFGDLVFQLQNNMVAYNNLDSLANTAYIISIFTAMIGILIVACVRRRNRTVPKPHPHPIRRRYELKIRPRYDKAFDNENEIRITLLGKTGNGKSATGNLILGEELFETKICARSGTVRCKRERKKRFGFIIDVVDTPGLFDMETCNEMVFKEIVKCIPMTSPGPHAFLLVLSATSRFTPEEEETVNNFIERFGEHIYHYLIVIITRKDELEHDKITEDQYIENIPTDLNNLLERCGNRYMFLNNRDNEKNKETQCCELLAKINENIKRQIHPYYTDENYQDAERVLKEREENRKKEIEIELLRQLSEKITDIKPIGEEEREFEGSIKELWDKKDKTLVERLADLRKNDKKEIKNETTKERGSIESLIGNLRKAGYSTVDAVGDAIQLGLVSPQNLYGTLKGWWSSTK